MGLLRLARGASVGTVYPKHVVLAQDSLVSIQMQSCEQETHHSISFVCLQGASLTDNEEMHGSSFLGQPKMSLSEGDACLTDKYASNLGETQHGGCFGQDAPFEE